MSYAIRKDGKGWRAVNGKEEVTAEEVYGKTLPDKNQKWDGTKWIDDPDQVAENQKNQKAAQLSATDEYMPRITEDLIDTLLSKGVISQADLPETVKTKLAERKTIRLELTMLTAAKP